MKKTTFTLSAAMLLATVSAFSAPVTPQQALVIAKEGSNKVMKKAAWGNGDGLRILASLPTPSGEGTACYVVGKESRQGYVLVAGDDVLPTPVLGYAEAGDAASLPQAMVAWLEQAGRQIDYLTAHPQLKPVVPALEKGRSVAPLLGDIEWGQQPYYNRYAPSANYPIGCVATSVGQVMFSHRYPEHGFGSNSYVSTTHKLELSQDFSQSTYEWDKMPCTLTSASTSAEIDAVAKFLYDVAISLDMDFAVGGSGAYSERICSAVSNHFGYSRQAHIVKRNCYTGEEWLRMLHKELDEGFAVVYGGATSGAGMGHSFVCDGYDGDNLYHINWGWNGSGNGYFALNALAYDYIDFATGQSMKDGFNYWQDMLIGMRPDPDGLTQWREPEMEAEGLTINGNISEGSLTVSRTTAVTVTAYEVYNTSNFDLDLESFGIMLYDSEGKVVHRQPMFQGYYRAGRNMATVACELLIPADLATGCYTARLGYRLKGEETERTFVQSIGVCTELAVVVNDEDVTYTPVGKAKLRVSNVSFEPDVPCDGEECVISVAVTNDGGLYDGSMFFRFNQPGDPIVSHWFNSPKVDVTIAPGETKEVVFTGVINTYQSDNTVFTLFDRDDYVVYMTDGIVTAGPLPEPELALTRELRFVPRDWRVPRNCMILEADIRNTGGPYDGQMRIFLNQDGWGVDEFVSDLRRVQIPGAGAVKTIHVMGAIDPIDHPFWSNEFVCALYQIYTQADGEVRSFCVGPQNFGYHEFTLGDKKPDIEVTWNPQYDIDNLEDTSGITESDAPDSLVGVSVVGDKLLVSLPGGGAVNAVTMFDAGGRAVAYGQDMILDVSALPQGSYVVAVSTTVASKVFKVKI